ncbi:FMN-binding protein [Candidatus Dependentiae bacterium]|nr:FMN-binding protein [Candidatus Dependentiae bacterium]
MKKLRVLLIIWVIGLIFFYNCKTSDEKKEVHNQELVGITKITEDFDWIKNHYSNAEFISSGKYKDLNVFNIFDGSKKEIGILIFTAQNKLSGEGYSGEIDLGIIFDSDYKIIGVEVIDHTETRSYLENVKDSGYLKLFKDVSLKEELEFDMNIEAVTGATITSKGIFIGVKNLQNKLQLSVSQPPASNIKKK